MPALQTRVDRGAIALVVILLLGYLLRSLWFDTDLYLDESDAMRVARAVSRGEGPIFETKALNWTRGYWPHPPLFIMLVTAVDLLSPGNPAAMRAMIRIFGVLAILVASLASLEVYRGEAGIAISILVALLLSANYFHVVVSNILADDMVLAFLLGLSLWLFCSYLKSGKERLLTMAGVAAGLAMFSKIGPSLLHAGILSLALSGRGEALARVRRLIMMDVPILAGGFLGLVVSWWAWGEEQMIAILYSFVVAGTRSGAGGLQSYLGRVMATGTWTAWYTTFPFVLAAVLGVVHVFRNRKDDRGLILLSFYTLIFSGFFLFVVPFAGVFRYLAPMIGPSAIIVGTLLLDSWRKVVSGSGGLGRMLLAAALVAFGTASFLLALSPSIEVTPLLTADLVRRHNLLRVTTAAVPLGVFATIVAARWAFRGPRTRSGRPAVPLLDKLSLLAMVGLLAAYAAFGLIQGAGYLEYPYARGIAEAGDYLRSHTDPDDVLLTSKDIAFYADRSYHNLKGDLPRSEIQHLLAEGNASYLAYYPPIPTWLGPTLAELGEPIRFGSTYVFNLTARPVD